MCYGQSYRWSDFRIWRNSLLPVPRLTHAELLASAATELQIMVLIDDGVASRGC